MKIIVKKTQSWLRSRRQHWSDYWKVKNGCAICGYNNHPRALCFDHIDPTTKNPITKNGHHETMKTGGMWQLTNPKIPLRTMIEEWRKCRILCANCHMELTYLERKKTKIARTDKDDNNEQGIYDFIDSSNRIGKG